MSPDTSRRAVETHTRFLASLFAVFVLALGQAHGLVAHRHVFVHSDAPGLSRSQSERQGASERAHVHKIAGHPDRSPSMELSGPLQPENPAILPLAAWWPSRFVLAEAPRPFLAARPLVDAPRHHRRLPRAPPLHPF